MVIKRREFLERSGWLLAALGISETGFWQLSDRYSQVLAQPTGRKLALLVGINDYAEEPLKGCLTDLELQRQLLIYKYGFKPADILTLADKEATRENIENAFLNHISSQAKPEDVVVFHFSGKGSSITNLGSQEENKLAEKVKVQQSLVTIDGVPSTEQEGKAANDLLLETLWLLMRSLPTEKVIAIVDASYNYPGTDRQGNLRIRVRPAQATTQINIQELAMQSQLRSGSSPESGVDITQFPGLVLAASKQNQFASERDWEGFSCGLFTYALTQSLWCATPNRKLQVSFDRAASFVEEISGLYQQPQLIKSPPESTGPGFLFSTASSAAGAIVSVEESSKTGTLWLGGVPQEVLELLETNSIFTTVPQPNSDSGLSATLKIKSRSGLTAKATIAEKSLPGNTEATSSQSLVGQLVREEIRILSKPINLKIALDEEGLSRIERVDATSGFSAIPQVSVVSGDRGADYVFSRVRERAIAQSPTAPLPSVYQGRYALFSVGENLIPNSVGDGGEVAKVAVQRLTPQMRSLQVGKILRSSQNESSSKLSVKATLATVTPESKVLMQRASITGAGNRDSSVSVGLVDIPIGSRIQFRLHNDGDKELYFLLLVLDTAGRTLILDPSISSGSTNSAQPLFQGQLIPGSQTLSVPPIIGDSLKDPTQYGWTTTDREGLAETYVIFCSRPFSKTIAALEGELRQIRDNQPIKELLNPFKAAKAVLQDLQDASKPGVEKAGISTDGWALDNQVWATLRFVYRLV
ncbi:MAG: caspase family protein [Cyanobacteriota bacterium]|nr:caspase family protein [Cyanobacteriota bacterium]